MKLEQHDIAIVGMAGIFPEAPDTRTYWSNILAGKCCIGDHPSPEAERALDPEADGFERLYTTRGGYLRDLATFDPLAFGVMPASIDGADPDHFLALRVAREALADADLLGARLPRERTEVIVGHGTYVNRGNVNWIQHGLMLDQTVDLLAELIPSYTAEQLDEIWHRLRDSLPPLDAQTIPGMIPNILAGRIANRFDLMGANYVVDGACASSLIALDCARADLLLGKCDVALVGGVQACIPAATLMVFCELGAMSRQTALRPFDRSADGTMLGEGVGMMVVKRRKDAQRDGDRIYAVIKGTGVASDGKSAGLLAPRLEGEALAIRRAYESAQVDPATVGLVEAHGTGIPLGDATEVRALTRVFGARAGSTPTCGIGSVKSMIGHCVPASGMASMIKTALALHHRILPPTAGFEEPDPSLELDKTPFYVLTEARPWIHSTATPRRAGVSTMGFGGINSHCVLEEAR